MGDQFVALGVVGRFAADAQPLFTLQAVVPRIGLNRSINAAVSITGSGLKSMRAPPVSACIARMPSRRDGKG